MSESTVKPGRPPKYVEPLKKEIAELRQQIRMLGGSQDTQGIVPPGIFFMNMMAAWISKPIGPAPADEMIVNAMSSNAAKMYDMYVQIVKAANKAIKTEE